MTQPDEPSAELLQQVREGSESAAATLFDRYVERLTRLARVRLSAKLARRIDPEDVVLSAYRSFFVAVRNGRFSLEHNGDLWRLLVRMTLHKLARQAAAHQAARRSINREAKGNANLDVLELTSGREPTPDEAVAVADELEALMQRLDESSRRVLELRLQGEPFAEIATAIGKSERHVRRLMNGIRETMQELAGVTDEPEESHFADDVVRPPAPRAITPQPTFDESRVLSFDDYLLQKQLGAGASGKVYLAREKPTGKTVAVKFLRKDVQANESLVRRFVEEARIVARLDHHGIVRIHGLGQTPIGGYFLVQDWIDGPNLAERSSGDLPDWRTVATWIAEAAEAIHHAHEQGVIHCDLKPANLLLDSEGRIRVTDFGLARRVRDDEPINAVAGTLGYLAPEQIDSCWGPIGPGTDVYGLGAVMYSMLTGRPPVTGERLADVLTAIVIGTPIPSVRISRCDIPSDFAAIVDRCLAKNPLDRFATAGDLSAVLRRVGSERD